jgi:hypothetical protein
MEKNMLLSVAAATIALSLLMGPGFVPHMRKRTLGRTPAALRPERLDPTGRTLTISLRKLL